MPNDPDIPKRLAARIRGAQERVRQKRLSITGGEYNYNRSRERVAEFEADPYAFAACYYGWNEPDSYPVQTSIARERERLAYHERWREELVRELAELETALMLVEEEVLVEVTRMRPTPGRVPWPRPLPPFDEFREQFEAEMQRALKRWRSERAQDDAEFERLLAVEATAFDEQCRRDDEEWRLRLDAMTPEQYANYRAWADYFLDGLKSRSLTIGDVLAQLQANGRH